MFYRFLNIILGISVIFIGLNNMSPEGGRYRGFVITQSTGLLIFIFGVVVLIFAVLKKTWQPPQLEYTKCQECGEIISISKIKEGKCPNCGNEVKITDDSI